jgi:hypothetical protein
MALPAEIDLTRVLEVNGALMTTVIHVHDLDTVGQFARDNQLWRACSAGIS